MLGGSSMDYEKVGSFIRQKRINKRITQQELADILFVDVTTVSKWERGKTFPDNSIITKLCETLEISEHELFVACEDQDYRNAKRKLNKIETGNLLGFFIVSGLLALAVLICFIVNLAVSKTLSWFWIVLTACLCGDSFYAPLVTKIFKKHKLLWFVSLTLLSMFILFLTCSIYVSNYWCFLAILAVILGYFTFFFPFIFYRYEVFKKLKKFFVLIYFGTIYLLIVSLLAVINSYVSYDFVLGIEITTYVVLPFLISGGLSLIPINKCFKGSAIAFVSTLFAFGLNGFLNYLLGGVTNCYQVNFVEWNNYSNGNVALIAAAVGIMASFVLLIFGIVNYKKSKKHIST